jgi:hypothetical protein
MAYVCGRGPWRSTKPCRAQRKSAIDAETGVIPYARATAEAVECPSRTAASACALVIEPIA